MLRVIDSYCSISYINRVYKQVSTHFNSYQQVSTVVNKFQQSSTTCQQNFNKISTEFQQRTETDSSKISDGNQKSSEFQNRFNSLYTNGRCAHPKHRHNLILYRQTGETLRFSRVYARFAGPSRECYSK